MFDDALVRSNHYSTNPQERVDWALVALHHDGSIAAAIGLGGFLRGADIARVNSTPSGCQSNWWTL